MNMSEKQYEQYVQSLCPKSPIWLDVCFAYLIGGTICVLGQLLLTRYRRLFE